MVLLCTHCRHPQRGHSTVSQDSTTYPLCHPNEGLDCYRLVTVYRHQPIDCQRCPTGTRTSKAAAVLDNLLWLAAGTSKTAWSRILISPETVRDMQVALSELRGIEDQRS